MPNRILRDGINSSPRVDALSDGAEILYRRLISVVDDYGRYYASPATLRGACWPLRPERVTDEQVADWLAECVSEGLVSLYQVDRGRYLQLSDFRQQIRSKSKFPDAVSNCVSIDEQLHSSSRSRISKAEAKADTAPPAAVGVCVPANPHRQSAAADLDGQVSGRFEEVWIRWPRKVGKDSAARDWISLVTVTKEQAVIACVERYLASDEVARGAVRSLGTTPDREGWLVACARDGWECDWPRARDASRRSRGAPEPPPPTPEREAEAMRALLESPDEPEDAKILWRQRLAEMEIRG